MTLATYLFIMVFSLAVIIAANYYIPKRLCSRAVKILMRLHDGNISVAHLVPESDSEQASHPLDPENL